MVSMAKHPPSQGGIVKDALLKLVELLECDDKDKSMKMIDNSSELLGDDLKEVMNEGCRLKIAAACFSLYDTF